MTRTIRLIGLLALLLALPTLAHASSFRMGASYADVYTRWSEYNGSSQRNYYEEEWLMAGAYLSQRFTLQPSQRDGLFAAWELDVWPGLSYKNWRDDGGMAFGIRPGLNFGYEGSIEALHIAAGVGTGFTWTLGTGDDANNEPYRELFSTSILAANIAVSVEWTLRNAAIEALGIGARIDVAGLAWTDNYIRTEPDNEDWFNLALRVYAVL